MDLQKTLNDYAASDGGAWLRAFDRHAVRITLLGFKLEGVATALYCALSDTIKVAPDTEDSVFFACVVHELYHACQRHTMGLVWYLLSKLFSRSVLEHPAKDAELDAVLWFCEQRVNAWRKAKEAENG